MVIAIVDASSIDQPSPSPPDRSLPIEVADPSRSASSVRPPHEAARGLRAAHNGETWFSSNRMRASLPGEPAYLDNIRPFGRMPMTIHIQRHTWPLATLALATATTCLLIGSEAIAQTRSLPSFAVDTSWAKVPDKYRLGDVSSIAIDAQDNAYVLHRPRTLKPDAAAHGRARGRGVRPRRQFHQSLGRPRRRATNGSSASTASTSTTRASPGSAATSARRPATRD